MPSKVCSRASPTALGGPIVDELTAAYSRGDQAALQQRARAVIDAAKAALAAGCVSVPPDPPETPSTNVATLLDYRANYVVVSWVGSDALTEKATYLRVVVHDPAADAYAVDLPGIAARSGDPQLADVFVSRSAAAEAVSVYTSTEEENPILSQLPAFVQAVAAPMFATIGTLTAPPGAVRAARARQEPAFVTVSRIGLPFRRASVRLQASARDAVDREEFKTAIVRLAGSVSFADASYSACARAYVADLAHALPPVADDAACATTSRNPGACKAAFDAVLQQEYANATTGTLTGCTGSKDAIEPVQKVDRKFRDLIATGASSSAEADITFHNRPLTRWSLGAGSAVIGYAHLNRPRVKLGDNNVVAADPLTRVLITAFVNWSPTGYDDTSPTMQPRERPRLFFGAALTPDFGAVGGANVMLIRGLGVSGGVGVLFAKGAEPNEIGSAPATPTDPFRLALAGVAFVGITYNYK